MLCKHSDARTKASKEKPELSSNKRAKIDIGSTTVDRDKGDNNSDDKNLESDSEFSSDDEDEDEIIGKDGKEVESSGEIMRILQVSLAIAEIQEKKSQPERVGEPLIESGECLASFRWMTAQNMRKLRAKWVEYYENHKLTRSQGPIDSSDWGGVFKRLEQRTIGTISYRCVLEPGKVVELTIDDLGFKPCSDDSSHIRITLRGAAFDFYLEKDEDLCLVRCLHAWLSLTRITKGYLFPKIYGHDQIQNSDDHISEAEYLENFRSALCEIGEPPELYTANAFQRGGLVFLLVDRGFSLPDVVRWAADMTPETISRYLAADTDIALSTPRDQLMLPRTQK
ncbi:hypothetical protein BDP27DRAFT_1317883 [Rhodocollybia butyracea]|uniref:Uncharacterized protein n=1 Tax=Rhodocollybia butyracea TaxID=206335 RepID=A0A9P5Q3N6_9AGAR|nr:hypothetical protein BDP27DRAFT_1317883 [Rhodocollybia butyracea]